MFISVFPIYKRNLKKKNSSLKWLKQLTSFLFSGVYPLTCVPIYICKRLIFNLFIKNSNSPYSFLCIWLLETKLQMHGNSCYFCSSKLAFSMRGKFLLNDTIYLKDTIHSVQRPVFLKVKCKYNNKGLVPPLPSRVPLQFRFELTSLFQLVFGLLLKTALFFYCTKSNLMSGGSKRIPIASFLSEITKKKRIPTL